VVRRRDIERDARNRARQVPVYNIPESIEAMQSSIEYAEGDLRIWLQAALQELRARQV
jgi:hypothetical protein